MSFPLFTYAVVRGVPFQLMTDEVMNPEPVTARVNEAPPGRTDVGEIALRTGVGFVFRNRRQSPSPVWKRN